MLVLTRKLGEAIRIGDDIEVVVTQIGHNRIRIGIDAPPVVRIRRHELAPPHESQQPPGGTSLAK